MTEIQKLSDFSHARLRTEMWLSSRDPHTQEIITYTDGIPVVKEMTWVPAQFVAFREILDNAIDEVITHRQGDKIEITYNPDNMSFSVSDNGRGIPIEYDKKHKIHSATMALTETKAGRNFGERGSSRGMNGVGASIVNFVSEYFDVKIIRDGKEFVQHFREGTTDLVIEEPMIFPTKIRQTGTHISWKLSQKVFTHNILPEEFIKSRVYELSVCYPHLRLSYNGQKIQTKDATKSLFPNHKPIVFEIKEDNFDSKFWLVPQFFENGEHSHSMVNAIPVFNGGTHIETFKKNFFSGLLTALESLSKKKKLTPNRSDISEGMLIYNITEMNSPSFDSQSKTRLINENVVSYIRNGMNDHDFFKKIIRTYPEWIESIYERCAKRTNKKDDDEASRNAKRNIRNKIETLVDSVGRDRSKCILHITEGESAKGGLVASRDSNIHAVLPLRGKIMNIHGAKLKDIVDNKVLSNIFGAIGLIPGQKANRHALRYGSVRFTCDADQDGGNIVSLLTCCMYLQWKELFDPERPYFYSFETPLIVAQKGKNTQYWYTDNYHEFEPDKYKGWSIRRCKGLAALTQTDWTNQLMKPKLIPIVDDENMTETIDMLFNETRADDRKEFMGI